MLFVAFFILLPVARLIWWAYCMIDYFSAKKAVKAKTDAYTPEYIKGAKTRLSISSALLGAIALIIAGFMIMLMFSIAYM